MGAAGLPVYTGQLGGSQVPRGGCRKRAHSPIEPRAHRPLCPPPSPAWPLPQTQPLFWLQQGCFPGLSTLRSGAGLCCIPGREGIQPRCRPAAALAQLAEKGGDFSRMEDISLPAPCTLGGSCSTVGCFSPLQNWGGLGLKTQTGVFTATRIIPQRGKLKMHKTAQQSSRHHPSASKDTRIPPWDPAAKG